MGGTSAFGSPGTDLNVMRAPRTSAESMKAGGLARDKVRNGGGCRECRFLSPSPRRWRVQDMGATAKYWNKLGCIGGDWLQMEVTLDELAEFFAVGIAHMHEFDAAAVRSDIADDGGEIDFAETGANFQFDRVADAEFSGGFQIGAAQADGLYASKARRRALDLRTKR